MQTSQTGVSIFIDNLYNNYSLIFNILKNKKSLYFNIYSNYISINNYIQIIKLKLIYILI